MLLAGIEMQVSSNINGLNMRIFQVVLFSGAAISFLISLFFIGNVTGDVFWRIGVSALLFDIVCIMLWPGKTKVL
jgi:hypothetical protein